MRYFYEYENVVEFFDDIFKRYNNSTDKDDFMEYFSTKLTCCDVGRLLIQQTFSEDRSNELSLLDVINNLVKITIPDDDVYITKIEYIQNGCKIKTESERFIEE